MTKKSKFDKAIGYAYRLFSIRSRSEKELKDRLYKKGFGRETVETVLTRLKENKIIDDSNFAKLWVESRMRQNPKGKIVLRKELREKGISSSVIESAISEKSINEDATVKELALERYEKIKTLPREKIRKRLFDFLARRGFDFETIGETIKEIVG